MQYQALVSVWIAIIVWASAFVGIRAALHEFSPGGLALLRFIIASFVIGIAYFFLKNKKKPPIGDIFRLLILGMIGVGLYNVFLNYGEQTISSGVSSFIISQSPLLTAIFAAIFLEEPLTVRRLIGFFLSIAGIGVMTFNELRENFSWSNNLGYIFLATVVASIYSISQKSLLRNAHPIEATTFIIWGSALFLCIFIPELSKDLTHANFYAICTVVYLGIFPAALGYIMWGYALSHMPTAQVVSYLYFSPFLATLIGWVWLGEAPTFISLIGGIIAMSGVYFINRSYKKPSIK